MEKAVHTNPAAQRDMRQVLADSRVAAVTIALLLIYSLVSIIYALEVPLTRVGEFIVTAFAIRGMPYFSSDLDVFDKLFAINSVASLYFAFVYGFAAMFLSRWVYGVGPIRGLRQFRNTTVRRNRA